MDAEMEQFCNDLLQSVCEMKNHTIAKKTEFIIQNDGSVRQLVTLANGTIERDTLLSSIAYTRVKAELSQSQFAKLLGVSVRTLQEWEQGRKNPSGAAKTLLKIAERNPNLLHELAF